LIHEIATDFEARAMEIATQVAGFSPTSLRSGMRFVHEVRGRAWGQASVIARRVRSETFHSPDFQEGIRAFQEKRLPKWPSLE
jgi:enoyl-CoA hydratase/carnithine racemase